MIDEYGYRSNVGIVLHNEAKQVLYAKRATSDGAWQFPQGGIQSAETLEEAMYRELYEELGLRPQDVSITAKTHYWVAYDLPREYIRYNTKPLCIGQKQRWFLLKLCAPEKTIALDLHQDVEFSAWRWVDFWYPKDHVVDFKQAVYQEVLEEFAPVLDV